MKYLTIRDIASLTGIPAGDLRVLVRHNVLQAQRCGNMFLVSPASLERLEDLLADGQDDDDADMDEDDLDEGDEIDD